MMSRLRPQASSAPGLSDRELTVLAALTDVEKLAVAHSIRLAVTERHAALLAALDALVATWREDGGEMVDMDEVSDDVDALLAQHREDS